MLRSLGAVVVGYVLVAFLSVASAGVSWAIFGAEGAFRDGSTVASSGWAISSCILGFLAAIAAGWVTAAIGRHSRNMPVFYLAVLLLVFGLALAVLGSGEPRGAVPEGKTTAELTFFEAGQVAVNPTWYTYVIGVIGCIGVIVGGTLRGPSESSS